MRLYLFCATCITFLLFLSGCGDFSQQSPVVAQKPQAIHSVPNTAGANGQNVASSRLDTQPLSASPYSLSRIAPVSVAPISTTPSTPDKLKAAILLPLSGKNAALGQAMLNAAQQAVFDAAGANFELQPHDTAMTGGAEEAAHTAIAGGAQLIIGPLFANDVLSVKSIATIANVPMLPLSTDTSLAERGVYVMGLAPDPQVERVVAYAYTHGAHHFAALIPATPYGALVDTIFRRTVLQYGGDVIADEIFSSPADSEIKIKDLAGQRQLIDALFLPEGGSDLKLISDQLVAAGFDHTHTHMLGTGLWDIQGLGRQIPLLEGGWYAAPDPAARHNFIAGYTAAYGQEPPRLATLAYDATALAAVLAKHAMHYDEVSLTNPNGFAGLDGIFRLTPSGMVERALPVNEVTVEDSRVVDAAATSFVTIKK